MCGLQCAWCQEAQEISGSGHSGILYQNYDDEPVIPLNPAAAPAAAPAVRTSLQSIGYQPAFFQQPAGVQGAAAANSSERDAASTAHSRKLTNRPLLQEPLLPQSVGATASASAAPEGNRTADGDPGRDTEPEPEPEEPAPTSKPKQKPLAVIPWGPDHPNW